MNSLVIDNTKINSESPTYIIAEIGINHNGDMNNVFKLIDIASEAGCNAVKFRKGHLNLQFQRVNGILGEKLLGEK